MKIVQNIFILLIISIFISFILFVLAGATVNKNEKITDILIKICATTMVFSGILFLLLIIFGSKIRIGI